MSVFIIAEAGVNHNGSIKIACKFQTFKAESLVSKNTKKADYQKLTTDSAESQFDMLKKLELDIASHQKLISYCKEKNIIFLSTPFDHESIDMLNNLGLQIFKIPSGEITNLPYLRHIGSLKKKVFLSTGMSDMKEIKDALAILVNAGTKKNNITVLHANTMYPTPMEDVNLKAMKAIAKNFGVKYGYSDHTLGIEVDIAAVAMGASVIEKHFTLDKNMKGPDHKSSLSPDELKAMVCAIRNIEKALGSNKKISTPSEQINKDFARKSITARRSIKKGERLTEENLIVKRPGTGKSPMKWDEVIGTFAKINYKKDQLI